MRPCHQLDQVSSPEDVPAKGCRGGEDGEEGDEVDGGCWLGVLAVNFHESAAPVQQDLRDG